MKLLYQLGIRLYCFVIFLARKFNYKAYLLYKGRKETFKILSSIGENDKPIWVHCASLGEFEQGRPVIEGIKKKYPDKKILLTFFSPSGYEIRKDYDYADYICYLPSDTKRNAKKFIEAVNPSKVIFVKYEFWYNYLKQPNLNNIPLYLISAVFCREHMFFKWYGGWYIKMLHFFTMLYVQDNSSGELLSSIGVKHFKVVGDTRFDRVKEIADQSQEFEKLAIFSEKSDVLIAGSTWPADEKFIAEYINNNRSIKLIIAPHQINDEHIKQVQEIFNSNPLLYTDANKEELKEAQVLIVNTMGMLAAMYKYGNVAYIGGGFGSGIHNTLEACVYGLPVVFGPNYSKFNEAVYLVDSGGGFCVTNQSDFNVTIDELFSDKNVYQKANNVTLDYVESMCGASKVIIDDLF